MVTLKQLEGFVCVVDVGSFRKAAEVLGTTQPNISNRIATLEQHLGVVLMHRTPGSVRLTDKGQELLVAARQVLRAAEAFVSVADRKDLISHRLRLGVTELIACTWLHPFLRRFREEYPTVTVQLDVDLSTEVARRLSEGQTDLILTAGPSSINEGAAVPIGTYPYSWFAAPDVSRRLEGHSTLAEVMKGPVLIHSRQSSAARELVAHCEARSYRMDRLVYSSSLASALQMAIDSMGVALLPKALARNRVRDSALVEVPCDWLPTALEFHARFDTARAPGFVRFAAELAAQISAERDD
ncbi:LysR family transcriptional regulator [Sulfitobacter alexandrii]|nr:LysR family transcriptional regulator [Sulfitobacter alexandrii]